MMGQEESGATNGGPRHVGLIMDGSGRWAQQRGRRRIVGHRVGAEAARRIVRAACRLGLEQLTVYAFSSENWRRPAAEVGYLMGMFRRFLRREGWQLRGEGVRLCAIGRLEALPLGLREEIRRLAQLTCSDHRMTLCLALNYGGRSELVDACRELAQRAARHEIGAAEIDEAMLGRCLYQPDMPPLDLIIRTAGEMRLSNFLLWQAAYAEFWTTSVLWPDFREEHLVEAVAAFRGRQRRFGGLPAETAHRTAKDGTLAGLRKA